MPRMPPHSSSSLALAQRCWVARPLVLLLHRRCSYVSKRPRIERVADDIIWQCKLLTEVRLIEAAQPLGTPQGAHHGSYLTCIVAHQNRPADQPAPKSDQKQYEHTTLVTAVQVIDAELEEEGTHQLRLSLTQPFPFEGCPPTTTDPCPSPGLARLIRAVSSRVASEATPADRNSLVKVGLHLLLLLLLGSGEAAPAAAGWAAAAALERMRGRVGPPPLSPPLHCPAPCELADAGQQGRSTRHGHAHPPPLQPCSPTRQPPKPTPLQTQQLPPLPAAGAQPECGAALPGALERGAGLRAAAGCPAGAGGAAPPGPLPHPLPGLWHPGAAMGV